MPKRFCPPLETLTATVAYFPSSARALLARWRDGSGSCLDTLSRDERDAADVLDRALPAMSRSSTGVGDLSQMLGDARVEVILLWCEASATRRDARLAKLLAHAAEQTRWRERVDAAVRDRIVGGPMLDALECAPLIGRGDRLASAAYAGARSRMEILIWEAGASALQLPELGARLWGSREAFDALVGQPARGALRGRVLAARCLEVCTRALPVAKDPDAVGRTLRVLQPLLLHPEPLVWVHAARALGLMAGVVEHLEGMLLDWLRRDSLLLRQRGLTAFASLPADRLKFLGGEMVSILDAPEAEPWSLAAAAAATPYLAYERRDLWDRLLYRIVDGHGARSRRGPWREASRHSGAAVPLRSPSKPRCDNCER